jgi:energy-converting hydrogenase Eha subunit G
MVFAQSLGEYGALSGGALASALAAVSETFDMLTDRLRQAESTTWLAIGAVAVVLWLVFRR